jgi:hypothetical protein
MAQSQDSLAAKRISPVQCAALARFTLSGSVGVVGAISCFSGQI